MLKGYFNIMPRVFRVYVIWIIILKTFNSVLLDWVFQGSIFFFGLFDQKYSLFIPTLKISMSFFHITFSGDRAKRVQYNGMLLASGKWNGEKLLNKYWIGPKSDLSKNWRSWGLWWAILLAQRVFPSNLQDFCCLLGRFCNGFA
jgi:hypothetical protein